MREVWVVAWCSIRQDKCFEFLVEEAQVAGWHVGTNLVTLSREKHFHAFASADGTWREFRDNFVYVDGVLLPRFIVESFPLLAVVITGLIDFRVRNDGFAIFGSGLRVSIFGII